eukprot:6192441-Pleurochrysis_carterae.AAC.1
MRISASFRKDCAARRRLAMLEHMVVLEEYAHSTSPFTSPSSPPPANFLLRALFVRVPQASACFRLQPVRSATRPTSADTRSSCSNQTRWESANSATCASLSEKSAFAEHLAKRKQRVEAQQHSNQPFTSLAVSSSDLGQAVRTGQHFSLSAGALLRCIKGGLLRQLLLFLAASSHLLPLRLTLPIVDYTCRYMSREEKATKHNRNTKAIN